MRRISRVTRRAIFDYLRIDANPWWGRLGDVSFLTRIYDLDALPSTDPRYPTARADIVQHRVNSDDWEDDWVFRDSRFRLASGPDEVLLDFLAHVVDPIVQPDEDRASKIVADLNELLAADGWVLRPRNQVSGRPVYAPARVTDTEDQSNLPSPSPSSMTNQSGGTAQNVVQLHTLHGDVVFGERNSHRNKTPVGSLIVQLADPFALEVHRPIAVAPRAASAAVPKLPRYIPRAHDAQLAEMVSKAAAGQSTIATLIGGSSTGKTRACWEAIKDLPEGWRLWHPISPERPAAVLEELPRLAPHTVVWLNEAQFYLLTVDPPVGERVAAGLRELLRDPERGPVLVLATIWPQYWQRLTVPPRPNAERDPYAQARMLFTGSGIEVPEAFNSQELAALARNAQVDPRLTEALRHAEEGRITQFLAGVPALLERYRTASPATKALIHAAMDARNLGCGPALPLALLEFAVPGYLSDHEWGEIDEDWLEQALDYSSRPCNGVRGPLTRIRPRTEARTGDHSQAPGSDQRSSAGQPTYRLADYLEETGRRTRARRIAPATFWEALVAHADPSDLVGLAEQASAKALHRCAALLYKRAVASGNTQAASPLINLLQSIDPGHLPEVSEWVARRSDIEDSKHLTDLLWVLRRAKAAHAVAILARRAIALADLTNPDAIISLLLSLHQAGAKEAVTELAEHVATQTDLVDPRNVARLLEAMRRADTHEAIEVLARRAAAQADLSDPLAVGVLLDALRQDDTNDAMTALLSRHPEKHTDCTNPQTVAGLLDTLHEAGALDAVAKLATRAITSADVTDPLANARLIEALRHTNTTDAIPILARRAAAQADLSDPLAVGVLLDALRQSDTDDAMTALLSRHPEKHTDCTNPRTIIVLLVALRKASADQAAATLAARAADSESSNEQGHENPTQTQKLTFGRDADGKPAQPWGWRDIN